MGGFGQGAAAAGGRLVGVADGAGQSLGDLVAGAQAGAEVVGQGEQGAPVLGGIEFVAGEGVFGADARGRGGGVDDGGVVSVGALVEGAAKPGAEQALQRQCGEVGEIADGVQPVVGECGRGRGADAGQFADGAGPQERGDRLGESSMTVRSPGGVSAAAMAASSRLGATAAALRTPYRASARSWMSSVMPRASRCQNRRAPVRSATALSGSSICTRGMKSSRRRRSLSQSSGS